MSKSKIVSFVVWICRKFSREEIEKIIVELKIVLEDPNADVKPKDQFKEDHPNYRNFRPDPIEPLTELPDSKKKTKITTRKF